MAPGPTPTRKFALSIDGVAVRVQNPTGGHVRAQVVANDPGPNTPPKRHVASISYPNLRVQLDLDVGSQILAWVNAALRGAPTAKSGSLIELDDQNRAKSYLDFFEANVADFVVPGFDSASGAANTFALEASIKKSVLRKGDSAPIQLTDRSKPFLTSNFRLTIDGLPTARVRTIGPVSFTRTRGIVPSDLLVTFSDQDLDPWLAWADDFIVKGHSTDDKERQGRIEVLGPNLADVLATIDLKQIGIFELVPTNDAAVRTHRAGLYFESAQLRMP
jgi:hypothetical protein